MFSVTECVLLPSRFRLSSTNKWKTRERFDERCLSAYKIRRAFGGWEERKNFKGDGPREKRRHIVRVPSSSVHDLSRSRKCVITYYTAYGTNLITQLWLSCMTRLRHKRRAFFNYYAQLSYRNDIASVTEHRRREKNIYNIYKKNRHAVIFGQTRIYVGVSLKMKTICTTTSLSYYLPRIFPTKCLHIYNT